MLAYIALRCSAGQEVGGLGCVGRQPALRYFIERCSVCVGSFFFKY